MTADLSIRDLEAHRVGQFFHSKKNRVFRSVIEERPCVVKVYRGEWKERAPLEFRLLRDCRDKGVAVPEPIALLAGAIVMAPVEGEVASDVFDKMISANSTLILTSEQERLANSLARWLAGFHSAFGFRMSRGDTILKNFVCTSEGIIGLDFEEAAPGDPLPDLGQLCASALMTDPVFTERKVAFVRHLADRYWTCSGQRREDELVGAVASAVRHYAQYRANGQELLAYASKVESGIIRI
jgi:aminoglycoside phosphotransferase (APT) family kinase protein